MKEFQNEASIARIVSSPRFYVLCTHINFSFPSPEWTHAEALGEFSPAVTDRCNNDLPHSVVARIFHSKARASCSWYNIPAENSCNLLSFPCTAVIGKRKIPAFLAELFVLIAEIMYGNRTHTQTLYVNTK